jgi:hypothetical protein
MEAAIIPPRTVKPITGYGTSPCGKCKREDARDKCHGSHKDRAKSQPHSFKSGFYKFFTMINTYFSKFNDENCILRCEPDQSYETYLCINIIGKMRYNH